MEIKWSPNSLVDIQRLYEFIESKNSVAAKNAIRAIKNAVLKLSDFPQIGKSIPNLPPEYREILIPFGSRGYIARYYIESDSIIILAIRHYLEVYSK